MLLALSASLVETLFCKPQTSNVTTATLKITMDVQRNVRLKIFTPAFRTDSECLIALSVETGSLILMKNAMMETLRVMMAAVLYAGLNLTLFAHLSLESKASVLHAEMDGSISLKNVTIET